MSKDSNSWYFKASSLRESEFGLSSSKADTQLFADAGIVTTGNMNHVIDRDKFRRQQNKLGKKMYEEKYLGG